MDFPIKLRVLFDGESSEGTTPLLPGPVSIGYAKYSAKAKKAEQSPSSVIGNGENGSVKHD